MSLNRRIGVLAMVLSGFLVPFCASAQDGSTGSVRDDPTLLPAGKRTTLELYVTARQAYDKWKAAPEKIRIIDVRTPEEFMFVGHAEMAWNIPVAAQSFEWDPEKQQFQLQLLPDFVARAQKIANPSDILLVMCRSGGRSAIAVNLLAKGGFINVYSITDGMEGDTVNDPGSVFNGQRLVNGWKNSGLPWTYSVNPDHMLLPVKH